METWSNWTSESVFDACDTGCRSLAHGGDPHCSELAIRIDERRRIGRDLHDGSAQLLVVLQLNLASLKRMSRSMRQRDAWAEVDQTIAALHREIRAIAASDIKPLAPQDPLGEALRQMASRFGRLAGMSISVQSRNLEAPLPKRVELALYRIAQEALANARRHGNAERALIRVSMVGSRLQMIVRDYGTGFAKDAQWGRGLSNIQDRVALLGGAARIARLADGMMVAVSIPRGTPSAGLGENPDGVTAGGYPRCEGGMQ